MTAKNQVNADPIGSSVRTTVANRLTQHEIEFMLALAIRLPSVYMAARDRLETDLFAPDEARYALLWRASVKAADAHNGKLPTAADTAKELVAVNIAAEIQTDTSKRYYTPLVEKAVLGDDGLLDSVFALPADVEMENTGYDLLVRFMTERKIADPIRRALSGLTQTETMKDSVAFVEAIEKNAHDIAGIRVNPQSELIIDGDFLPPGPKISSTKVAAIDELLNGGQAPQECYVLLGPSSGGKSCLGAQIALEGADTQAALAAEVGSDQAGYWYYFSWELNERQIRARLYGHGARIHADSFKEDAVTRTRVPLSTAADLSTLKPYEYDSFVNSPGNPMRGELERLAAFKQRFSHGRFKLVDYSGTYPGCGLGEVPEVVRHLSKEVSRGRKISGIVIDYAGIAVQRHIAARGLRPDSEYSMLSQFVDRVRSKICIPFDCTAWVLHQLHGDSARRSSGGAGHHSEARGCRNFADNADFGLQMSNYDKATGLMTLSCTKHRRAPGLTNGVITRLDGRFGVFLAPDQQYVYDPYSKKIVPKTFLDTVPARTAAGAAVPVDPRIGL